MRYPVHHARLHPRQVVPAGPAVMPQGARPTASYSMYFTEGGGAMTFTALPTATQFVVDSTAMIQTPLLPSAVPKPSIHGLSSSASVGLKSADSTSTTLSATSAAAFNASDIIPGMQIDPFQQVYNGMILKTLHSSPPWVIMGAIGGAIFMVLLAAYCYFCRWYYKRLPRSTARWDVDDRAKKDLVYGDQPHYSPNEEEKHIEEDRRNVPVGDSYFPQGETWRKFEGRTANHPESFIYTGDGDHPLASPHSPGSPGTPPGAAPSSRTALPRPRPRFAAAHRGHVDSVFSTVSFPTTHRAESIRDSNFYPDGFEPYEHDGEIWDLASPGFAPARPSMDSTARSVSVTRGSMSINRGSIFGELSARARGSVVIYDSAPLPPLNLSRTSAPVLDEDPFAGPGEGAGGSAYVYPIEKYAGRKTYDGGKKSMDGLHMRTRSREVKLDTLVEDADEGRVTPIPRL
ncbi:transmembrane protein [Ceratobasidium sp. AG-Ba]|nr:transmembrane protein [Ceratobasidium sp. AG-Ba]